MKTKNGFTLVEIIVVIVILGILAAASIPAMLGFVGDARKKSITQEAMAAYRAAQTIATEMVGTVKATGDDLDNQIMVAIAGGDISTADTENSDIGNGGLKVTYNEDGTVKSDTRTQRMKDLLGNDATGEVQVKVHNGKITYFYYKRQVGGEYYDYVRINSEVIAEYGVTE